MALRLPQSDEDEGSLPQGSANRGDPGKSKDQRKPSRKPAGKPQARIHSISQSSSH